MEDERKFFLKSTRYYGIALGILLFAPVLLAAFTYRGTCTPMLDGPTRPCSLSKYVYNDMIFPLILIVMVLVPIPVGCWGYAVGRYWKYKLGGTGISRVLPFLCPFIGAIIVFSLRQHIIFGFAEIVRWALSAVGL